MMKKILCSLVVLCCSAMLMLTSYGQAWSASAEKNLLESDLPVKINANDMEYDINGNYVTFKGNVYVERGNFTMTAPKMTIFLKQSSKKESMQVPSDNIPLTGKVDKPTRTVDAQNKIDKIEAYNGVKFNYESQSGSAQTATYNANKGVLTLKGNPVVQEGKNSIRGETILYYLYERRSEVVGSEKKRVEAIFENK